MSEVLAPDELAPEVGKRQDDDLGCPDCAYVPPALGGSKGFRTIALNKHRKKEHAWSAPPKPPKSPASKEKPPRVKATSTTAPSPRRRSLADWFSGGWGVLAGRLPGRAGAIAAWEAPAAGQVVDQAIAGTWLDKKVLQRFAAGADKWQAVADLAILPVCGMLVDTGHPLAQSAMVREMATSAVVRMIGVQLEAEAKANARMAKLTAQAKAAGHDEDVSDLVRSIVAQLFGDNEPGVQVVDVAAAPAA